MIIKDTWYRRIEEENGSINSITDLRVKDLEGLCDIHILCKDCTEGAGCAIPQHNYELWLNLFDHPDKYYSSRVRAPTPDPKN